MPDASNTIIELEKRFWQALVAGDTNTALSLLAEPAVMVNGHGALQFTRAQYRQMAQEGPVVVTAFTLDDMTVLFANDSTAVVTYRATQHVWQPQTGFGYRKP
ncbi:MAG: nuclear transport factor 2 family protein, partial [Haliea sp.]